MGHPFILKGGGAMVFWETNVLSTNLMEQFSGALRNEKKMLTPEKTIVSPT